jgi:homospermidine synthase
VPRTSQQWAALSHSLGIKVIHIAERDTQRLLPQAAARLPPGTFINTWSVDGYVEEGVQPAELGWGSHEKALPLDAGCHTSGEC